MVKQAPFPSPDSELSQQVLVFQNLKVMLSESFMPEYPHIPKKFGEEILSCWFGPTFTLGSCGGHYSSTTSTHLLVFENKRGFGMLSSNQFHRYA